MFLEICEEKMVDKSSYKIFDSDAALEWGMLHYGDWLLEMQNQDNQPQNAIEMFFRNYTQGIHFITNQILRSGVDIEKHCINSMVKPEMIYGAISEIKLHLAPENIIVYRYISKDIVQRMLKWNNLLCFKKGGIVFDKAFLSTTLTPETVQSRNYSHGYSKLLKIFVPKGTPCLYLDLISDMGENEMLFLPKTKLRILSSSFLSKTVECIIED